MAPAQIELIELREDIADAAERRALCTAFYEDVYREAFPKPDQSENPEIWLPLLDDTPPPPAPLMYLVVARRLPDGRMVGGVVVEYFRASHAALVTYIAVAPEGRQQGLARQLLDDALRRVAAENGGRLPRVFGEVERPEAQANESDRRKAEARLGVISALGGWRVDLDYIQPGLGEGKPPLTDLMLVLLSQTGEDSVPADEVRAFVDEFFASLEQHGSPEHGRVLRSLRGGRIALKNIVRP